MITLMAVDQGVAACAGYAGPAAQWLRYGGLIVIACLGTAGFAMGMTSARARWGMGVAVATVAGIVAIGAIELRMSDIEQAVAGLCSRAPLMLDIRG